MMLHFTVTARIMGKTWGTILVGNNLHWQWKLILPVGTLNLAVGMPCAFYSQQKIDRVMSNLDFNDVFQGAHAIFQPYCIFDHAPAVLSIPTAIKVKPRPFKFVNIRVHNVRFTKLVSDGWNVNVSGFHMFKLVQRLKNLKRPLRKMLYDHVAVYDMVRTVNIKEVKYAIFSMRNDKSPGPDGFTAVFFKEAWDIVGNDVTRAVCEFFTNGKLLNELNHTIIALIPKVPSHSHVNDFRPISCCNVLFKVITKIIANRLKESLKVLVSPNQSAFVLGWNIADSILLTQELMLNYHLDRGIPRCAFKVDIQKAYDTVAWVFSKSINGNLHGYFKESAKVIMEALDEFKCASGLILSLTKSTAYFCNVLNHVKLSILQVLPFDEGKLPVKYFGVPLVSSRLIYKDCKELIEKVQRRVNDWKNKSFSTAGRLQLIQSVVGSLHVYWASMFILLTRILLDIEQMMRGFLWCQGSMQRGMAKFSWEDVCLHKDEGGLGIRRSGSFNQALMVSHLWKILTSKDSLWVKWIHVYKLKDWNFWDVPFLYGLEWLSKYPNLLSINVPNLFDGVPDSLVWKNRFEAIKHFSVQTVWNDIRPRGAKVDWYFTVWFSACIPRHALNLWMIVRRRLKTQDKLRAWDHSRVQHLAGLPNSAPSIDAILLDIAPFTKTRTCKSIVTKLVVAGPSTSSLVEVELHLLHMMNFEGVTSAIYYLEAKGGDRGAWEVLGRCLGGCLRTLSDVYAINERVNVTNTLGAYFTATNSVADWSEIRMGKIHAVLAGSWEQIHILNHLITLMKFDKGEPVGSTALGAATSTGSRETTRGR
uniref:Reverse transcriptase domain-containing protein n=1 Tax=Tanacetum cinerariifolium TaxID=118510 RepID=A0A6L2N9D6_TANCI|nr:hypothetical protein [Tanacetum cinerariifolium]